MDSKLKHSVQLTIQNLRQLFARVFVELCFELPNSHSKLWISSEPDYEVW